MMTRLAFGLTFWAVVCFISNPWLKNRWLFALTVSLAISATILFVIYGFDG